jgi:23S rRNA pseudouridine1911/1915/1917 synthase
LEKSFVVTDSDAGARLDVFCARHLPDTSRAQIKSWILAGTIQVDGKKSRPAAKVLVGQKINIQPAEKPATPMAAQDIALDLVFRDAHLAVVHKRAGMVVHPGAGNPDGTLLNALLFHLPELKSSGMERPGLVHRLDKETSGLLVCALSDSVHQKLSEAFKLRQVRKTYRAFVVGHFKERNFEAITGHARHPKNRKRYTTRLPPPSTEEKEGNVRLAHSIFAVVEQAGGVAEVLVDLKTGRTHQIRAHLADRSHPIVGDALYGGDRLEKRLKNTPVKKPATDLKRHALHAEKLGFTHPVTGEAMEFIAPLPPDLQALSEAIARFAGETRGR